MHVKLGFYFVYIYIWVSKQEHGIVPVRGGPTSIIIFFFFLFIISVVLVLL